MTDTALKATALNALHRELGARMVPFAGYDMPVQYPLGVKKEHLHTRAEVGLFDVSHMGQIRLTGQGVAEALEAILPQDVIGLPVGRQRYGLLLNEQGGIRDDLMIANRGDDYLLVVNAACKEDDAQWLRQYLPADIELELLSGQSLIALQGPKAREALARLLPGVATMTFMDTAFLEWQGVPLWLSCSGYTGEDGFEISLADAHAEGFARRLLEEPEVAAIGLGARDSLRLEAGLCLYGHDMDQAITPVEAGLLWSIQKVRRPGGERAGGYIGDQPVEEQLLHDEKVKQRRVLLDIEGRAPVREDSDIVDENGQKVGRVCSGGFGPSVGGPIAMAYISAEVLNAGASVFASVRGKAIPVSVRSAAFFASRYFRG